MIDIFSLCVVLLKHYSIALKIWQRTYPRIEGDALLACCAVLKEQKLITPARSKGSVLYQVDVSQTSGDQSPS